MSSKRLVFLFGSAPYDSPLAQEGLDALLAAAIFDQSVSVLFIGDGAFQLIDQQHPSAQKSQAKMLQALSMYDIDECYIHTPSADARGLSPNSYCIKVAAMNDEEARALLAAADHVLSF